MSISVQTLVDDMQTIIGDDSSEFEAVLVAGLKEVLGKVQGFTKDRSFKLQTTKTLSSGSQTIDLSDLDDLSEELFVYYLEGGEKEDIEKPGDEVFNQIFSSSATGPPDAYRIRGTTMEFDKLAEQNYTIYIEYLGVESESITVSTTLLYPSDVIQVIREGLYEVAYDHREQDEKRDKHGGLFAIGLERLEAQYSRNEQPDHVSDDD